MNGWKVACKGRNRLFNNPEKTTYEQPIECVLLVDTMIIQLELNKISYYFLHISHGKEEKHHSV